MWSEITRTPHSPDFPQDVALQLLGLPESGFQEVLPSRSSHKSVWRKQASTTCVLFVHTIVLFSHASKVMLKILQARLQQYVNQELPNVQAGFQRGRETRDLIAPASIGF